MECFEGSGRSRQTGRPCALQALKETCNKEQISRTSIANQETSIGEILPNIVPGAQSPLSLPRGYVLGKIGFHARCFAQVLVMPIHIGVAAAIRRISIDNIQCSGVRLCCNSHSRSDRVRDAGAGAGRMSNHPPHVGEPHRRPYA